MRAVPTVPVMYTSVLSPEKRTRGTKQPMGNRRDWETQLKRWTKGQGDMGIRETWYSNTVDAWLC